MKTPPKLTDTHKHLMRLIGKETEADGWATVSKAVFPLLEAIPTELIELQSIGDCEGGRVRLTTEGQNILTALAWL